MECMLIDDIILAGKTEQDLEEVKTALSTKFNIKDLGELNYFLRIKVDQKTQDSIRIAWNARLQYASEQHSPKQFAVSLCLYTAGHFICDYFAT